MKNIHLLGMLPFIGMLGGLPFANRETPYILGMPFLHFWIVLWIVLTFFIMLTIYTFDQSNRDKEGERE
ncbi:DUF3311 domain-containing protein [Pseudobacillus sp. 179-B 2D1 NHS]|uniref:DUF3311 domain-containing protein n=1 Tax=Pseudobacillus sp. 179-B 2D1 NHS TaxID=3374292 RepID=UPI0038792FB5